MLDTVNMDQSMGAAAYAKAFHRQQIRLHDLQRRARETGLSMRIAPSGMRAMRKRASLSGPER